MVLHSAAFMAFRVMEIIVAIPIIGMLGYFVDPYVKNKAMIPDRLLAWFIISILACAWALVTVWQFKKYRSVSGPLIAGVDALFMGAFIGMVIIFRGISDSDCGNFDVPVGVSYGDNSYSGGNKWGASLNRPCAMYKANWALSIIEIVCFFLTAVFSWTLYRSYRLGATHHSKEYTGGRRSGSTSSYSSHRHRRHRGAY